MARIEDGRIVVAHFVILGGYQVISLNFVRCSLK